jgi:hypothetical protein
MQEKILSWQGFQTGAQKKSTSWYWSVGIVALGVCVASFIAENILLGILAILSALAVMLAGSQPGSAQTYALSKKGVHLGSTLIPFENISLFSIQEHDPQKLTLQTSGLTGTVSIPLTGVDFRAVRSELKNQSVEEVDELHSFGEKISEMIGM